MQAMCSKVITSPVAIGSFLAEPPQDASPPPDAPRDWSEWVLLGESAAVRHLRAQVRRISPHFRTALIRGEAGTGKSLVARAIHAHSPVSDGPFVVAPAEYVVECLAAGESTCSATIHAAASLLASAQGGVLYLEGVGELSYPLQTTIYRFIRWAEERRTAPTNSTYNGPERRCANLRSAPTRILASSRSDLRALALTGRFRQDLYTHLSAVEIIVPPLQQRVDDISELSTWLLNRLAEQAGQPFKRLTDAAMAHLKALPWPNNLRELEESVSRAASLAEDSTIERRHLLPLSEAEAAGQAAPLGRWPDRLHDVVQLHVLNILTRCGGNKLRAAELLGISRSTLYRMLGASQTQPNP
jgi:DNA-binding NtrC family response regulator